MEGAIVNVVDNCSLVDGPINKAVIRCSPTNKFVSPEEPLSKDITNYIRNLIYSQGWNSPPSRLHSNDLMSNSIVAESPLTAT